MDDKNYYNFIDFLLDFKLDIDKGYSFEDYMSNYRGNNQDFVYYMNIEKNKVIGIYYYNLHQIPGLPEFTSYWCSTMVDWIKKNGSKLERIAKVKSFI